MHNSLRRGRASAPSASATSQAIAVSAARPSGRHMVFVTLLVMLAVVLMLAGCNRTQVSEHPPEPGDVAVARVNGQTVWSSDVRAEAIAQGQIGPGEPLDMTSDLFARTLQEVVDQKLLARAAQAKGLDKSITAQRRLQAAQDRILGDMLVENAVDRQIDDKAVKEQYDEQVRLAKSAEEIRARLIVLKTRDDAAIALKQLQGGAVFEALAMEHSIDQPTRFNGGDMGYLTTDIMPQAYRTALATAKAGELVGPVQTDEGWAVLRVEDRRAEQLPTLEEERPVIMRYLVYNQVAGLLKGLRGNAKIDILLPKTSADGSNQEPASAPKDAFNATGNAGADAASGTPAADEVSSSSSSSSVAVSEAAKAKPRLPDSHAILLPGRDPTAGRHLFAPAGAKP